MSQQKAFSSRATNPRPDAASGRGTGCAPGNRARGPGVHTGLCGCAPTLLYTLAHARLLTSSPCCLDPAWDGDCSGCTRACRVALASVWPLQPGPLWVLLEGTAAGCYGTRREGAGSLALAVPPPGSVDGWSFPVPLSPAECVDLLLPLAEVAP